MSYTIVYQPNALEEFNDAVLWYGEKSEKIATNFVNEIKDRLKTIFENPYRFRKVYKNFRETSLKKYPFYIVYSLNEKDYEVIITSIYHHRRNPKNKYLK